MKRWALLLAILAVFTTSGNAQAQDSRLRLPPRPEVTTPRLYILDCGGLALATVAMFQLTLDEVKNPFMANMCFLIVHPKGTLIWETGLPDRWVGRPLGEAMSGKNVAMVKTKTLVGQLADIGYTPEMIDYIALSHFHYDHTGNSNLFARTATWLVSQPERDVMFPAASPPLGHEDFALLKEAKTVLLGETHDVFGDGAVVVRRAAGHTPGHSVLQVNLKNTGPVILAGDLFHYAEEITLGRMPKAEEATGTAAARAKVFELARALKAKVWITHDMELFVGAPRAPAYHD